MGDTYLNLVNKAIRKVNDIELTSATFAGASGFSEMVKDAINDSIRRVNQDQHKWPFNYTETTQVLTADTAVYSFPSDFKVAKWDSFMIQKDSSLNAPARNLSYIDYDEWISKFKEQDNSLAVGDGGLPSMVYRTPNNKFGLSTLPDAAYTVAYSYWAVPDDLSAYGDTTSIPIAFNHVIVEGALYYIYLFRSNETAANMANSRFKEGLKHMRTILLNPDTYAWDTRSTGELTRNSPRYAAARPI